jgi:hypothetical protein
VTVNIDTLTARLDVLERVIEILQQQPDPAVRTRGAEAIQAVLDATRRDLAAVDHDDDREAAEDAARFVDRHYPIVAAFLADEQEAGR